MAKQKNSHLGMTINKSNAQGFAFTNELTGFARSSFNGVRKQGNVISKASVSKGQTLAPSRRNGR